MPADSVPDLVRRMARVPGDRYAAWDFVRAFTAGWLDPELEALPERYGDEEELDEAETRLGLRIPAAMREAHLLFGHWRGPDGGEAGPMSPPDRWFPDEGGRLLVFDLRFHGPVPPSRLAGGEEMAMFAVPLDRPTDPDPPVMTNLSHPTLGETGWLAYLDSFSLALVEAVLSASVLADSVATAECDLDEEAAELLRARFVPLGLPAYPLARPYVNWYAGHDVILRESDRSWLRMRARDFDALWEARQALPVTWR